MKTFEDLIFHNIMCFDSVLVGASIELTPKYVISVIKSTYRGEEVPDVYEVLVSREGKLDFKNLQFLSATQITKLMKELQATI